jgi:hypothetical protein
MLSNWCLSVITMINGCGMRDLYKLLEAIILIHWSSNVCWRNWCGYISSDMYVSFILIFIFIHQWLYRSLLGPGLFYRFIIFFTQSVGLLGRVTSPSHGRYLHRTTQTQNKRTQRHSCLEWDSNTRFQRWSERIQFMPEIARPLWWACFDFAQIKY